MEFGDDIFDYIDEQVKKGEKVDIDIDEFEEKEVIEEDDFDVFEEAFDVFEEAFDFDESESTADKPKKKRGEKKEEYWDRILRMEREYKQELRDAYINKYLKLPLNEKAIDNFLYDDEYLDQFLDKSKLNEKAIKFERESFDPYMFTRGLTETIEPKGKKIYCWKKYNSRFTNPNTNVGREAISKNYINWSTIYENEKEQFVRRTAFEMNELGLYDDIHCVDKEEYDVNDLPDWVKKARYLP